MRTLTAQQWQDWIDFASVEPIGAERDDWRLANAVAGLAAMWAETPEDVETKWFMIDWLNDEKSEIERYLNPSPEQVKKMEERLKAKVMGVNAAVDGRKQEKPEKPEKKKKGPKTLG